MHPRLTDLQPYETRAVLMDAARYNRVRLALLRLGAPIRLHLKPLKHLGLLLDDDAWICFDEVLDEYPVIAWTDFQTAGRDGLHQPVACTQRFYHEHAERAVQLVFTTLDAMLDERLREAR